MRIKSQARARKSLQRARYTDDRPEDGKKSKDVRISQRALHGAI